MANVRAHRRFREVQPGDTIRILRPLSEDGLLAGQYLQKGQTLVVEAVWFKGCVVCIGLKSGPNPIPLFGEEFEVIVYP